MKNRTTFLNILITLSSSNSSSLLHNFLEAEMTLNSKYKAYTNSIFHSFSEESIVQQF